MSKKVKVSVVDNKTLRLEEDAQKGSIIDLNDVMELDTSSILKLIEDGRDKVYDEKVKQALADQHKLLKSEEENKLLSLKNDKELELTKQKQELLSNINNLNNQIDVLKTKLLEQAKSIQLETEAKFNKEINELNNQINKLKSEKENQKNLFEQTLSSKLLEEELKLTKEFGKEKEELQKVISEQESDLNKLRLSKDSLNVKMLGENLEKWCEQEFVSSTLSMLPNVSFYKDTKGETKADFIFKVYLSGEEKLNLMSLPQLPLK